MHETLFVNFAYSPYPKRQSHQLPPYNRTELDAQLPNAIVSFVASHLELKNTLDGAKEEMASAAKAAQDEARNKSKTAKKSTQVSAPVKKDEQIPAEPPTAPGLFDTPAPMHAQRCRIDWNLKPEPKIHFIRVLRALPMNRDGPLAIASE